jgi:DNA-binding PadR family transcriptional regulator
LQAVAHHDGQWSWYQLDRHVVRTGIDPAEMRRLMPTLKSLIERGLLRAEGSGPQPRYHLTDAGWDAVAE